MSGTMNIKNSDGSSFATANLSNTRFNDIDFRSNGVQFTGRLTGSGITPVASSSNAENRITGHFFGPKGQEIGGHWNVRKDNGELGMGVFRAKR